MFLSTLKECKRISGFDLYAYCLMTNHVHLLLKVGKEPLEMIFRRLGSRYVYWYNRKYQRTGHLFQDRYRSEPIENEAYFLTALRYIIQNPMKAGMEESPGTYPWSSYSDYLKTSASLDHITDVDFAMELFQKPADLLHYLREKNNDAALDINDKKNGVTDAKAGEILRTITGCRSVAEFQTLKRRTQKEYARQLYECDLSMGQIARITGMSKATVCRAVKA